MDKLASRWDKVIRPLIELSVCKTVLGLLFLWKRRNCDWQTNAHRRLNILDDAMLFHTALLDFTFLYYETTIEILALLASKLNNVKFAFKSASISEIESTIN